MDIERAVARRESDAGATAVEYAIIIGLIAVVIIAGVTFLGTRVDGAFGLAEAAAAGEEQAPGDTTPGGTTPGGTTPGGTTPGGTTPGGTTPGGTTPGSATARRVLVNDPNERANENAAKWEWTCDNGHVLTTAEKDRSSDANPATRPSCA